MNYKTLLLSLFSMVVASASVSAHGLLNTKLERYLAVHVPYAEYQRDYFGIPASITLAQGILESGFGESDLAIHANNFFGIKVKTGWNGLTYAKKTEETENGKSVMEDAIFRRYETIEQAYFDRSYFLQGSKYYVHLFELSTMDYVGWARGLFKAGYATGLQYDAKLINLIEKYQLYKYDRLLDNSEIAYNQRQRKSQWQMTRIDAPVVSAAEMYRHTEAIAAACEREYATMQQQIIVLKSDVSKYKALSSETHQELFNRLQELELYVIEQQKLLIATQACVRDLEIQVQNINNSDPLKKQFTADGQPRTQLEFYPVTHSPNKNVFYNNGKKVVNLPKDKDLLWVATEFNIEYRDLLAYNELSAEDLNNQNIMLPNMFVYLEPKANSSNDENKTYTVRLGESLHNVAQLEGIKLSKLAQRNQLSLDKAEEPAAGQTLFINKKSTDKPVTRNATNTTFGAGGINTASPKK